MDWLSTIVGAAIGFVSSIGIVLVQRLLDGAGKLEIFVKIVYDRPTGSNTWGFHQNADGIYLNVPIWIQIQNLSNSSRMMRDVNLILVNEGKEIRSLIQSSRTEIKNYGEYLYANEGCYSLSADGKEIKQIDCHFLLKQNSDISTFDEIMLRYYDEKNCAHKFSLGHVNGDWQVRDFPRNGGWVKLEEKK